MSLKKALILTLISAVSLATMACASTTNVYENDDLPEVVDTVVSEQGSITSGKILSQEAEAEQTNQYPILEDTVIDETDRSEDAESNRANHCAACSMAAEYSDFRIEVEQTNSGKIEAEHLYGRWVNTYGGMLGNDFVFFEGGGGCVFFAPDGTAYYLSIWEDFVRVYTWQLDGDIVTMENEEQIKVGIVSREVDPYPQLNRELVVIAWQDEDKHWGLYR